jgi:Undecaprenyl-phosphate glucose phosphotransferase
MTSSTAQRAPSARHVTPLDAAGLQALAAAAVESSQDPANRRGPFRPERLATVRERQAGRASARFFRLADVAAVLLATTLLAHALTPGGLLDSRLRDVGPLLVCAPLTLALLRSFGLYRFGASERLMAHLAKTLLATILGAASALVAGLPLGLDVIGVQRLALWAAVTGGALYLLHLCWSLTVRRWRAQGLLTPNVVVVGATRHAERLIHAALSRRDVNVLGVFDDRLARSPTAIGGVPVLGDVQALIKHRLTPYVDRVVVALDPTAKTRVRELTERLRILPNAVSLLVDIEGEAARSAALTRLADTPLAQLSGAADDESRAFAKRLADLVFGALATVLAAPVMFAIAVAIRLDSPGPIFFRQRRHGFNNEEIVVWKFRSMRADAADHLAERQVTVGDERVTRVGRFIRKTSLDELPQLFNVLKGEMSLVGPRPHAIGMKTGDVHSHKLVAEYAHRHRMKPGMTGWAAINGSRGPVDTPEEVRRRVALDIEYIERQSFWLDLWILLVTVPCLIGDRNQVR